ncbi:PrsW family intramembrane metalloprotease [Halorubrum ezzemoulense]|uniref:PrsW family intramembrane metalloprotease n=1 Tax=Halorubrum ezzemoulense TaxID=337243 RepID=A0ABT4YYN2_HALEZ|nr:PrsW family intramembrane metalloprotease [Halorubrum ezzemoulense]MDB2245613.1 PrsW family intramembrane metalloprotease [Halorubrum ezzemoulense]MDB2250499.1 PrsW family intramembrane metalloprotease [Halorubrum ezzemoulense]MDB2279009.1 PrsW family intramembrane metalloprotease [Halorubrum ezzemoulense]MDB2285755.1 PrsW family intramembrane metalloprotease [Halorubrum ezzemoulense]MDB2287569.1 PrsW family intramembrane metalloprotease [Halorubrum ezzemoulense]
MTDRLRRLGRRLAVAGRRVLRVAKWESARASGGVDRRTLAAGVALLLVAGGVVGVGVATGVAGLDVDQDVYRVGVDAGSPYAEAIEEEASLRPVPAETASLGDSADAVVVTVVRPGSVDDGAIDPADVESVVVRATDTRKGEAAAASVREAVEAHNERLLRAEPNRTAAFPVTVTLRYVGRTTGFDDGATLGGSDGSRTGDPGGGSASDGDDGGTAADGGTDGDGTETSGSGSDGDSAGNSGGADSGDGSSGDASTDGESGGGSAPDSGAGGTADPGSGGGETGSDGEGGFAIPSIGGGAFGADTTGSPASITPPFPFTSLLLAFAFLVPMNFLIQAYGSSILDERTNRRGEPLLVTPLAPAEIVAGKTLPYAAAAAVVTTLIALVIGGGPLSVVAVAPVAATFLGATFVGAMFARSFKELTFVTVGVSVLLTTYAFVPAIFTNVTPVALVSPLTLVVFDLQGEAVSAGQVLFSTAPMAVGATLLFGLGLGVYREEDMFSQKPVTRKFLDALAVRLSAVRTGGGPGGVGGALFDRERLRALGSVAFLTACTIPFVFVAELLAVAVLFALPVTVSIPVLLVTIAFIEEVAKSVALYAGFERGVFERSDRVALAVGVASGTGFFLAEKATAVVQAVGLTELFLGRAAFADVAGLSGLPPIALVALFFAPLVLHVTATSAASLGARRGRTAYALTLTLATLGHAAYNVGVVSLG